MLRAEQWTPMVHLRLHNHTYSLEAMFVLLIGMFEGVIEAVETFDPPIESLVTHAETILVVFYMRFVACVG